MKSITAEARVFPVPLMSGEALFAFYERGQALTNALKAEISERVARVTAERRRETAARQQQAFPCRADPLCVQTV